MLAAFSKNTLEEIIFNNFLSLLWIHVQVFKGDSKLLEYIDFIYFKAV